MTKYDSLLDDVRIDDTNFSYKDVDTCVFISSNQQMAVFKEIHIDNSLILEGDLILEE